MLETHAQESPESAWSKAIGLETLSHASRRKCCPKGAFLGICSAQMLISVRTDRGIPNKNGTYAVAAIELLRRDAALATNKLTLWRRIPGAPPVQNGQLDVVLALWSRGKLRAKR